MFFFHFPSFTDFERAVTLSLVRIFLNFKNGKKSHVQAVSKIFNKLFLWMKSSCPKHHVNMSTVPDFAAALWCNREYLGRRCERPAFLNNLHAHIRSGAKGASAIGPQMWGEVFSPGGRGKKSLILSGLSGPHAVRCAHPKLLHWKGVMYSEKIYAIYFKSSLSLFLCWDMLKIFDF